MKVLITDKVHPVMAEMLQQAGLAVEVRTDLDYDGLMAIAGQYDALVVRSKVAMDRPMLDRCRHMRCIGRVGAGMETIDTDYAAQLGILCLNSPEGNRDAVGEHALALLLALFDKITVADRQVRHGRWLREENRGLEIKGKTIGIIGFGNMGGAFAQRLQGFECRVLAYDLKGRDASGYERAPWAEEASLEQLQRQCDVVSLHVPLTPVTRHLANAQFFDSFARPIYLINTSRGAVVDTPALAVAMQQGRVAGAALDVLEYEDMANDAMNPEIISEDLRYLFDSERMVLTPHVAGWTVESKYKLAAVLAQKMIDALC